MTTDTELRVLMEYDGTTASMRVLEMPEEFRENFAFTASNGMDVESRCRPALYEKAVALRGTIDADLGDAYDHKTATLACTREEFDAYVLALREAKKEMARLAVGEPPVVVVI